MSKNNAVVILSEAKNLNVSVKIRFLTSFEITEKNDVVILSEAKNL